MNAFDNNRAVALCCHIFCRNFRFCLCQLFKYFFVGKQFFVGFLLLFHKTVDNLTFFQTAVSDCRTDRIPVSETIFFNNFFNKFRFCYITEHYTLGFGIAADCFFAFNDVFFFKFCLKPLINLIFCLGTFYNIQPVTARSFGVLRSNNLDPVAVLNNIINIHKSSIGSCADHLIADCRMNTVGKVYRCGTVWQALDIARRRKTINTF